MSDHNSFLAEIGSDPNNPAARLVYADWLEERGDPRGELIRLRETLKTLSPFDEPYWDLKDRFKELRNEQDAQWLAALQYDAVYRPMFTELPMERGRRWRLVEEFIELWHEPLTRESGNSIEEIEATEASIGKKLPAALGEWYQLAGRRVDIWSKQDHFYSLDRISIDGDDDSLCFRGENQGCEAWGVYFRDLHQDDPPVAELLVSEDEIVSHCNVSQLAIQTLVLESIWCGEICTANDGSHSDEADRALKQNLHLADLPNAYWAFDPVYFHEGTDLYVVESVNDGFTYLACRTQAVHDSLPEIVRSAFPREW